MTIKWVGDDGACSGRDSCVPFGEATKILEATTMTKINAEAALKVPRPETDAEAQAFARGVFIGELVANSAQALDPPKPPTRKRKPNPVKIAQSAGLPIEKIAPDGTVHIARGNAAAAYEAQLTPDEELAKWSASRAH